MYCFKYTFKFQFSAKNIRTRFLVLKITELLCTNNFFFLEKACYHIKSIFLFYHILTLLNSTELRGKNDAELSISSSPRQDPISFFHTMPALHVQPLSKRVLSADFDTIYTIYLSLCIQSADGLYNNIHMYIKDVLVFFWSLFDISTIKVTCLYLLHCGRNTKGLGKLLTFPKYIEESFCKGFTKYVYIPKKSLHHFTTSPFRLAKEPASEG